jgi:hypothetical protein
MVLFGLTRGAASTRAVLSAGWRILPTLPAREIALQCPKIGLGTGVSFRCAFVGVAPLEITDVIDATIEYEAGSVVRLPRFWCNLSVRITWGEFDGCFVEGWKRHVDESSQSQMSFDVMSSLKS